MAGIGTMGDLARVNTNVGALNTYNHLRSKNKQIMTHQERLSTGQRINRSADAPANYVITRKMTAKQQALSQAQENIGDAVAAMSEADSGLTQIVDVMLEMKSLAQQAQSDTVGLSEREAIEFEIQQYAEEIDDIADDTNWQGSKLLSGKIDWKLQVGAKSDDLLRFAFSSSDTEPKGFDTESLGMVDLKATSFEESSATWEKINSAMSKVLSVQEKIGSVINRMDLKQDALNSSEVNTAAAISSIRDADIALEQMNLAKENILQQISLVMLTQAEQAPGNFMSLFK